MHITAIAALDRNRVIGHQGQIPWNQPRDMQRFKVLTSGKTVLMGRETYLSIGHALPNRRNLVLSKTVRSLPDCEVFPSVESALSSIPSDDIVYVIGGASVYSEMLPYCEKLSLTMIETEVKGDRFFPPLRREDWILSSLEHVEPDSENCFPMDFITLIRAKEGIKGLELPSNLCETFSHLFSGGPEA